MSFCQGESSSGNIMSQHSIYMAHAKRISRSVRCIAAFSVTENTTQGWTERGRQERLKRWVWRTSETKLSWLLVSWMRLVLQITPGLEFIPATLMCSDLRDYESFPKGFSLNFLQLIIYLKTRVYLFGQANILKSLCYKQSDILDTDIAVKFCQRIFPLVVSPPPLCSGRVRQWCSIQRQKGFWQGQQFYPCLHNKTQILHKIHL